MTASRDLEGLPMSSRRVDVIVLGAGMVGVSAALALQERGRTVVLVDRHGEAADETTFGNAGLIQSEAVIPYTLPRAPAEIANAALNRDPRAHIRYGALPANAQALWQYYQFSNSPRVAETAAAMKPLVFGAAEDAPEARRGADAGDLLRPTGWIKVWRTAEGEDARAPRRRGLAAIRRPGEFSRSRRADRARAQPRRGGARRGAFSGAFEHARSASARAGLCRAVRRARRPVREGRRDDVGAFGGGLDGHDR